MTYLLALQKAVAQTQPDDTTKMLGDEYLEGWECASLDLEYGATLSGQAVQEHISHWLEDEDMALLEDKGYLARIKKINQILLDTPIQSA
jgi:hypothetical protein